MLHDVLSVTMYPDVSLTAHQIVLTYVVNVSIWFCCKRLNLLRCLGTTPSQPSPSHHDCMDRSGAGKHQSPTPRNYDGSTANSINIQHLSMYSNQAPSHRSNVALDELNNIRVYSSSLSRSMSKMSWLFVGIFEGDWPWGSSVAFLLPFKSWRAFFV
ncbi:hypothetical protein EV424DRAFT_610093 [Suillus variegatus]|nr:hypothetical protein EV424DRAFT_610093 [Suillus variegatus]